MQMGGAIIFLRGKGRGKRGQIFIIEMKEKGRYATIRNVINEDLTPQLSPNVLNAVGELITITNKEIPWINLPK